MISVILESIGAIGLVYIVVSLLSITVGATVQFFRNHSFAVSLSSINRRGIEDLRRDLREAKNSIIDLENRLIQYPVKKSK